MTAGYQKDWYWSSLTVGLVRGQWWTVSYQSWKRRGPCRSRTGTGQLCSVAYQKDW